MRNLLYILPFILSVVSVCCPAYTEVRYLAPPGAADARIFDPAYPDLPGETAGSWWQDPTKTHIAVSLPLYALRRSDHGPGIGKFTDLPGYYRKELLPLGIDTLLLMPHFAIHHQSPYAPVSLYALNALYIDWSDVEEVQNELLDYPDFTFLLNAPMNEQQSVHYESVQRREREIAFRAWRRFQRDHVLRGTPRADAFEAFQEDQLGWLDDYARFQAINDILPLHNEHFKPAYLWGKQDIAYAEGDNRFENIVSMHKYAQWIAYQQFREAIDGLHQQGCRVLFDIPFFRAKHSIDTWKHPRLFQLDDGAHMPGIVRGELDERWGDLALWDWPELTKGSFAAMTDPIEHWLAFGLDGARCDALHFAYNFEGKLYPGDEPEDDLVQAIAGVFKQHGALPLAEAYEGTAERIRRFGFLTFYEDWKQVSHHDDPRRYKDDPRPAEYFRRAFYRILSGEYPGTYGRFISFTLGDQWGDIFPVKEKRNGKAVWRWRIPLRSDPDYAKRSLFDMGPYLMYCRKIIEGNLWNMRDEITDALMKASDLFVKTKGGGDVELWAASRDWFMEEWGRDTFISLPGLLLATGRFDEARRVIMRFARFERQGIIPNRIPDPQDPGSIEYNNVDGSLWFIQAVKKYFEYRPDDASLLSEAVSDDGRTLLEVMHSIIHCYQQGTGYDRYGRLNSIRMDSDGLIISPSQATWMDADPEGKDEPVTPRDGKAVEVNALWYAGLIFMAQVAQQQGDDIRAGEYGTLARKVKRSFNRKLWDSERNVLYDFRMIKGSRDSHEQAVRPNMIFAVSHGGDLLSTERQKHVFHAVQEKLLTPFGLRTLSPDDDQYRGIYHTDRAPRDKDLAYHQGTVWPWLAGPYIDALVRVRSKEGKSSKHIKHEIKAVLKELIEYLLIGPNGSLPEVFNGDAPHNAGGNSSQAWSVAEVLRAVSEHHILDDRPITRRDGAEISRALSLNGRERTILQSF